MLKIPSTRIFRPFEALLFWACTTTVMFFAIHLSQIDEIVLSKFQSASNVDIFTVAPWAGWYTRLSLAFGLTHGMVVSLALAISCGLTLTCVTILTQIVGWTLKSAGIFILLALNGSTLSRHKIFSSTSKNFFALAVIVLIFYFSNSIISILFPFFLYLALSFCLGIWRFLYSPSQEVFGPLARQGLAEAWKGSKVLGVCAILILVMGGPIINAAHKDAPVMQLIVIVVGASVLLFFTIKVIEAIQAAMTVARDERRMANLRRD